MAAKKKILLAEDEKMIADMYSTKFTLEGYDVAVAHDGAEALAKAKAEKPDIMLLDIIMPKLDGFATLKAVREDADLKATPVILLTNLGQEDDIKKGKELGADDYFVKANHSPQEIVEKVTTVLAKHGA
jgi:two-component system alkaline phosphatase synthesis response regulator PhoP